MLIRDLPKEYSQLCQIAKFKTNGTLNSDTLRHIELAALNRHFEILKNEYKEPIGYVIWCKCSKENILQINKHTELAHTLRFDYEYNSGRFMYILDVVYFDPQLIKLGKTRIRAFRAFIKKYRYVFANRKGLVMYTLKKGNVIKINPSFHLRGYSKSQFLE